MATERRRDRARQLLQRASRGPAFDDEQMHRRYRLWSTTWLLPDLCRLIPELKTIKPPPITSEPDPFWLDPTFNGGSQ